MPDDEIQRLVDEQRLADAAGARARERWLRQQDSEEATLAGVLVALGEREAEVMLRTVGGRVHRGVIGGVGQDFCRLRTRSGEDVLVALRAVVTVRPVAARGDHAVRAGPGAGGAPVDDLSLGEALGRIAPERPEVAVGCVDGGPPLVGRVRSVGRDVLTLQPDGEPPTPCHVALLAVADVTVRLG